MILHELRIPGPRLVEQERHGDERGFFARTFAADAFRGAGLDSRVVECSVSFNRDAGTLRGLHFQRHPSEEAKLVRCTRGRIWDVAVDVRPASPTFAQWLAADLDADGGTALYIPAGFAHGFITLEPASEVHYQMSQTYVPGASVGFRWDDPEVAITWPAAPVIISAKDRSLPTLATLSDSLEWNP